MIEAAILWRRLDIEGHDSCQLVRLEDGWRLTGMAVFGHEGQACVASYEAESDAAWRTRSAKVTGWLGSTALDFHITADTGKWKLNDVEQPQVAGCIDVDLGFTPATNLLALRRHALTVGQQTAAPAAYLAFPELRMQRLEQTYRRLDATKYNYIANVYGYDDVLEVSEHGFVLDYPGLWKAAQA
jgi:uncharacterized protein